jgi:hypothetical protein
MRASLVRIVAASIVAASVLFTSSRAAAEDKCSNITLHGTYVYSADGFVAKTPGQPPFTPIAEAGTYTFDGAGGFTTTNTLSFGGLIITRTETGTYAVNPDCTGSASINGGVTFTFAIAQAAKSFRFVVSTTGVTVSGTMDRQ